MNEEISMMMETYNTYDIDWMGDKINNTSDLTRHHIVKKCTGGNNDIDNYALLTTKSHHLIHYLENNNYKDYCLINNMLLELNKSSSPPTNEYFDNMKMIIKRVNKIIKNKRRKGK